MVFVSEAVSVEKSGVKRVDKDQMSQPRHQGLSSFGKTNELANERSSFALTKGERSYFLPCNLTVQQQFDPYQLH